MVKKIAIIGAGIIGAALAYRLQSDAVQVTLIDAGDARATEASFGWINASFYLSADHYRLRAAGIDAYTRLASDLSVPLRRTGCLNWEFEGAEMDAYQARLEGLGYPVERIGAGRFAALEPAMAHPPAQCLLFPSEAVAEPGEMRLALLMAAQAKGARVMAGVHVLDISDGVQTTVGAIAADEVVVAAGTGTSAVLETAGFALPMLRRPAYVVETKPIPQVISHVLVGPHGEVRQRPDGVLIAPAAVAHQSDAQEAFDMTAEAAAEATIARLQTVLPEYPLSWAKVTLAHRPVPGDDLPVIGRLRDGLSVACMHSGVTLAAVVADLMAVELVSGPSNVTEAQLAPFRPTRFQAV